jgi:hypothetical protein
MAALHTDGVFEGPIFAELARRRVMPVVSASAIVIQNKRYALATTMTAVFHLGRGYAGRRFEANQVGARLIRAAACAVLPAVLMWRTLSSVLGKRRDTARVLKASGALALITLAWSIGECAGYLLGVGDSDSRWR